MDEGNLKQKMENLPAVEEISSQTEQCSSLKVKCPYRWDFQILGSLVGLLLWMSGNLGQMAKTAGRPKCGGENCQTVFLRSLWTDMERSSRVVWAVQARGRGIIPGGTLRKVGGRKTNFLLGNTGRKVRQGYCSISRDSERWSCQDES